MSESKSFIAIGILSHICNQLVCIIHFMRSALHSEGIYSFCHID